jgi:hypothetical protein
VTNPRIETIAEGITKERIAVQTHLFYDPATGAARIAFQSQPSLYVGTDYKGVAGDYEILSTDLTTIAATCFGHGQDPVTEADLSQVSAAGMVLIIKQAFAALWDARVAAEAIAAHDQEST